MQEFFKQQAEWLKTWQENQEKLTKQYAEASEEWRENIMGKKQNSPDFFEGWAKSQEDLTSQFMDFTQKFQESLSSAWGGKVPGGLLKFMNLSFFEEFYKHWLSGLELPGGMKNPLNMAGGWDEATKFLQSLLDQDNPFFSFFNNAKFSDEMGRIFGMLQGAGAPGWSAFGDLLGGYENYISQLVDSTTAQSVEKLSENFEAWAKEMEKHLLAPKVGINRELAHDMAQALVLSQDYFQVYGKMARLVEATSRKAGTRFQTKLSEMALQKKPVIKFPDFCALWAVEYEAVFLEVMGSQEYAKLQGEFVDAGHRLKIQWNRLAEEVLESTPIALKRDLDLAICEIHQLKREMKALKRSLKVQVKATEEAQAAVQKTAREAVAAARDAAEKMVKDSSQEAVSAAVTAAVAAAKETAKSAEAPAKPARATRAKRQPTAEKPAKTTSRKTTKTNSDKE